MIEASRGMSDPTSEQVVAAAISGDRDALRTLWQSHRRWVAAILLAHKPRESDLEDLLQDVAMAVVGKIGGLREAGAFRPWLRAVALNAAKTAGRRRRSGGVLRLIGLRQDPNQEPHDEQASADGAAAANEEGARLMRLAASLPDGYREPLLMRCLNGMGYREIGQVMGLPETTIETRIARGRRMLRELAEKPGGASARQADASAQIEVKAGVR
jgi:RNA polymerase sigma-70 factor (ECF subfamily)